MTKIEKLKKREEDGWKKVKFHKGLQSMSKGTNGKPIRRILSLDEADKKTLSKLRHVAKTYPRPVTKEKILLSLNDEAELLKNLSGFRIEVKNRGRADRVIQYRVNGRLDIYPKNKKWHDLLLNRRGSFTGSEVDFVRNYIQHGSFGLQNKINESTRQSSADPR